MKLENSDKVGTGLQVYFISVMTGIRVYDSSRSILDREGVSKSEN